MDPLLNAISRREDRKQALRELNDVDARAFPGRLLTAVSRWREAIEVQKSRIDIRTEYVPSTQKQTDAILFLFALRQLLRAIDLAIDLYQFPELEAARSEFENAVPQSILLRDVESHFDDYELGIGRNQSTVGDLAHTFEQRYLLQSDEHEYVVWTSTSLSLQIVNATREALKLASVASSELEGIRHKGAEAKFIEGRRANLTSSLEKPKAT